MNAAPATRQATSQHWVALTTLFTFASIAEIVLFANLSAFTPIYLQHIGFAQDGIKFWTGILASVGMLLGFWFVPLWGVLADRYGRKALIVRSSIVEVVAIVIMALAPNIWIFTFGRMITGLALGNTGLMFAAVAERAPHSRVAFAISIITSTQPLGGVIGSLIGGFIVSSFGIIALWWFDAVLISAVVVVLLLFYNESFTPTPTPHILSMLQTALRAVVTTPVVVKYFAFSFVATAAYFFTYPYISPRLLELSQGINASATIGTVFGIAGIATLAATPLWGWLAGRHGGQRLVPFAMALTALAYLPLYFADSIVQFTIFYFILSGFSPAVNALTFSTIGLATPRDRRNSVMSMIYMPLNAAIVVAPALASVAAPEVRDVFLFSFAIGLVALGLLLATRHIGTQTAS